MRQRRHDQRIVGKRPPCRILNFLRRDSGELAVIVVDGVIRAPELRPLGHRFCNRFGVVERSDERISRVRLRLLDAIGRFRLRAQFCERGEDLIADIDRILRILHAREDGIERRVDVRFIEVEEAIDFLLVFYEFLVQIGRVAEFEIECGVERGKRSRILIQAGNAIGHSDPRNRR